MVFSSWLRKGNRSAPGARRRTQTAARQQTSFRPRLEVLEDRMVPSGYQQINLVGYQPGMGHFTDPNLNGWGMTSMPDGSFCVANTFATGLATFYEHTGHVLPQTINVPVEAHESAYLSSALGVSLSTQYGHPTGVVYNPTKNFVITNPVTGVSAPATLIFDTIDGTISGWNPIVDPTHAIVIRDTWTAGTPAIYTGLEIGQDSHGNNVLYAADFLNNQLQVINGSFTTISTTNCARLGVSSDPYSWVWSVQAVNDKLYVTFADLLNPAGSGGGAVDVFDTDGNFQYQLDANGPGPQGRLQNPWGITQAPANFGAYSIDLLIGNVAGAGNINVYDPNTHKWLGQLRQPNGTPIAIKGLWDLEFGDGTPHSGKTNQLFFDAGPNHPGDSTGGLFGVIRAAGHQGDNGDNDRVREMAAPAQPVQRTLTSTLTVTNAQDSGHGSLRAEIAAAHSGDTIVFSPKLDGKTIKLTTGELDITKNLTIQGRGADQLTISGNSPYYYKGRRVFEVAASAKVTISGLTISDGSGFASFAVGQWDGYGGDILNHGTLTVNACTINQGHVLNKGGGIFSDGTLTVNGCTISGNDASWGAGIWNTGTATFVSSTISNNHALSTSSGYTPDGAGGGILNVGTLTLSGCTVSGNYTNSGGGGIYSDGTLTVSGCTVSSNYAAYGAGIANWGTATFVSSTISNNQAFSMDGNPQPYAEGGGILNGGRLTVSGCTVTSNSADYEGAGIYNDTSGTVTVENASSITGNNSEDVYNLGVLYLDSSSTIGMLAGNPTIPI